ncbi:hypothetical protein B566_EDAN016513 [Ephemera danica]|nr:hypothetical protein B566_EDAN016513 [Ephemera danica]
MVLDVIKSLSNWHIAGPDEVPYSLIKYISTLISVPLAHIINYSLRDGYFPMELKIASVFPLHKKGEKVDVENYRNIAKQSVLGKIFEFHTQHGFTANKSINTALFDFLRPLHNSIENKQKCIILGFDVRKAFDSLDHDHPDDGPHLFTIVSAGVITFIVVSTSGINSVAEMLLAHTEKDISITSCGILHPDDGPHLFTIVSAGVITFIVVSTSGINSVAEMLLGVGILHGKQRYDVYTDHVMRQIMELY